MSLESNTESLQNILNTVNNLPNAPSLQSKSVTYTENGSATVTPDEGYYGLSSVDVTVNAASGGVTWYSSVR